LDWRDRGELHHSELPAFPGVLLPTVSFPRSANSIFLSRIFVLPFKGSTNMREKVKRDYPDFLDELTLPTTKGDRGMVCIEWEALGHG